MKGIKNHNIKGIKNILIEYIYKFCGKLQFNEDENKHNVIDVAILNDIPVLSYDGEGNELHLEDVLGTESNIVTKPLEDEYERRIVLEEIERLAPRDKEIMILRYGLGSKEEMTQKDVAELLGISQSYISRIEKKTIRRLKSLLKN